MIYIASPYSTTDAVIRSWRYMRAFEYAAKLMEKEIVCFSPVVYGHQFFVAGHAEQDFRFWRPFNDHMLHNCSEVHVLKMPGWEQSHGISYEIEQARLWNKPVKLIGGNKIEGL